MPYSQLLATILHDCYHDSHAVGQVYFIHPVTTKYVKIGYTTDLFRRQTDLQVGWREPLVVLALLRGGKNVEKALHRVFRADRAALSGADWEDLWAAGLAGGASEWFVLSPALINFMCSIPDTSHYEETARAAALAEPDPSRPAFLLSAAESIRELWEAGSTRSITKEGRELLQSWQEDRA